MRNAIRGCETTDSRSWLAIRRKEGDPNLLLLDAALGSLLNVGPYLGDIGRIVLGGDGDGLDEELVSASGIWRWVFLHGLE